MKTLYFSIANQFILAIKSNRNFIFTNDDLVLLQGYVPGINILKQKPKTLDITINHTESKFIRLNNTKKQYKIFYPWEGKFPKEMYHLIYGITRVNFLKNHLYPVHAACVGKEKFTLIIGHSGAGKTSTLLELVRKYNHQIFSGNKTLLGLDKNNSLTAIGGTKTITLQSKDKGKFFTPSSKSLDYWDRCAFLLPKNKYTTDSSLPISSIVIIKINDKTNKKIQLSLPHTLHNLYPYFLDTVNADIILGHGEDVFIGTPPKNSQKKLLNILKTALTKIPVYKISGSVANMALTISQL